MNDPYMYQKLGCAVIGMGHLLVVTGVVNMYAGNFRDNDFVRDLSVGSGVGILGAFSLICLLSQVEIK